MTGPEDESLAQHWLHPFHGDIEFVAWEGWHDHVAQDQVKVCGNDSSQSFDTIFNPRHFARIEFQKLLKDRRELVIILEQQDAVRAYHGHGPALFRHELG